MENIKEVFKEKNFDDLTLHYINNFIEEFNELFGEYVSKEELVKRIKENLNYSFEFADLTDERGIHNGKEKKITLANSIKDNEEEIKEVIFHEMIHCITARKGYTCFSKSYSVYGQDELKIITAHGLTEGFTQYLTQLRNERFNHEVVTSYPILAEQTINLAELLGEETLINLGLNNPDGLYDAMEEHHLIEDIVDYNSFLDAFDAIWQNEKEIFRNRKLNKDPVALLMRSIFGRSKEITDLDVAKKNLIEVFLNQLQYVEVESVEDLEDIYNKIYKYSIQIDADDNSITFNLFWEKLNEYIMFGHSREEILASLSEDLQVIVSDQFFMQDFLNLPPNEQLQILKEDNEISQRILGSKFENNYISNVIVGLFGPEIKNKKEFYFALINGLAEEIINKGYDINKLSIEIIDIAFVSGVTFNLYENTGEEVRYLSTYSRDNVEDWVSEFSVVTSQEEIDNILGQYPDIPENAVFMKDKYGCIIAYSGDNEYLLINDMEEEKENHGRTTYVPSALEREYEMLKSRMATYEKFKKLNPPPHIMENQIRMVKETYLKIANIEGRISINLDEIGDFVQDVQISEVAEMLNNHIKAVRDRRKAIEDEIGYRE